MKTASVKSPGSTLAVQYHVPNSQQKYPVVAAKRVAGTSDWTKLEIEIGPPGPTPPEIGCLMIILEQDGAGATWFDDLEVVLLQ